MDAGTGPVKHDQSEGVGCFDYKWQHLTDTRVNDSDVRSAVAEIVPQRPVAPNTVVNVIIT